MTRGLKKLTYAALATLLMITVAGNLPSLTTKVPQEFVSAAQVFALFAMLLLAMALLVHAVILRERTAMRMGIERWSDMNCMLRALSKLAFLAAVVAADRILPYLTGDSRGDGKPRLVMAFIAMAVDRILLYLNGIARGDGAARIVRTFVAVAVDQILLYLNGVARADGAVRLVTTVIAVALASWWLLGPRAVALRAPKLGTVAMMLAAMLAAIVLFVIAVRSMITTAMAGSKVVVRL